MFLDCAEVAKHSPKFDVQNNISISGFALYGGNRQTGRTSAKVYSVALFAKQKGNGPSLGRFIVL